VLRLDGKVAIVTGCGSSGPGWGNGKAMAVLLARQGAKIAGFDRDEAAAAETKRIIEDEGGSCFIARCDATNAKEVNAFVADCLARLGRIDILINNVGGTIWARPFAHYEEDQITAEIRRSLFPTLWCCRAVLPLMLEQGAGTIVNVSSIATRGLNRVPYAAAKGGVNALTACLAWEYAEHNIRVCGIAPGGTEAPPRKVPRNLAAPKEQSAQEKAWWREVEEQTKASSLMKRYGTIEEQAAAILFFASDEASYITGVILPVGGGDLG
jgi:dihydroxycyclohexadiene carboxylate dehydrogenase